jgi:hypothetical protein
VLSSPPPLAPAPLLQGPAHQRHRAAQAVGPPRVAGGGGYGLAVRLKCREPGAAVVGQDVAGHEGERGVKREDAGVRKVHLPAEGGKVFACVP